MFEVRSVDTKLSPCFENSTFVNIFLICIFVFSKKTWLNSVLFFFFCLISNNNLNGITQKLFYICSFNMENQIIHYI